MLDLHLHSTYSDGDVGVAELVKTVKEKDLEGFALTDHNGLWGLAEAQAAAEKDNLKFLEGIEITAQYEGIGVHVLGYSQNFVRDVILSGLAETRQGYEDRIKETIRRCQQAGFTKVKWENVAQRRAHLTDPVFVTHDVAQELIKQHDLSLDKARQLTVIGGDCYVPYGSWALAVPEAIRLIQQAEGMAVLAHPGTIAYEGSKPLLDKLLNEVHQLLDGIEVLHPFNSEELQQELTTWAGQKRLIITGGSDWHGPGRYHDTALGQVGVPSARWQTIKDFLSEDDF